MPIKIYAWSKKHKQNRRKRRMNAMYALNRETDIRNKKERVKNKSLTKGYAFGRISEDYFYRNLTFRHKQSESWSFW